MVYNEYIFKIYYLTAGVHSSFKSTKVIFFIASSYREAIQCLYEWLSRFDDIALNTYRVTVSFLHSSFYSSFTEPKVIYNVSVDYVLHIQSIRGGSLK